MTLPLTPVWFGPFMLKIQQARQFMRPIDKRCIKHRWLNKERNADSYWQAWVYFQEEGVYVQY